MNLQQLEYIIAVAEHRHFIQAAESCFVTQATLSAMIRKFEQELGVVLFDRSRVPVKPTPLGEKIIAQAKLIVDHVEELKNIVQEEQQTIKGFIRLGIIPTLAPYLLPLFLKPLLKKYPNLRLKIHELPTEDIIHRLAHHQLDLALLATPLHKTHLLETPLFQEPFYVYTSGDDKKLNKKYILPADLSVQKLWLLEEGHCMRNQMIHLCELTKTEKGHQPIDFESGSVETLVHMVDSYGGATILPALACARLSKIQQRNVRTFKSPLPVREISLVTHEHFNKKRLIHALHEVILMSLPKDLQEHASKKIMPVSPELL